MQIMDMHCYHLPDNCYQKASKTLFLLLLFYIVKNTNPLNWWPWFTEVSISIFHTKVTITWEVWLAFLKDWQIKGSWAIFSNKYCYPVNIFLSWTRPQLKSVKPLQGCHEIFLQHLNTAESIHLIKRKEPMFVGYLTHK